MIRYPFGNWGTEKSVDVGRVVPRNGYCVNPLVRISYDLSVFWLPDIFEYDIPIEFKLIGGIVDMCLKIHY